MEEDKKNEGADPFVREPVTKEDDAGSMYVAVIGNDGTVLDATPITPEALTAVQETLRNLQAVSIKAKRAKRVTPFPEVTSQHTTPFPGTDSFLVLTGSFGPNVAKQPTLWSEGQGFDLTTPSGKLRVQGQTIGENTSLQHYVTSQIGPEGLKELAGLLDVYNLLTQGQDQMQNVEVTAKQVLQRIGKGDHADDDDEQ